MNHPRPPRAEIAAAIDLVTNPQAAQAAGAARLSRAWSTIRASRRSPDMPRIRAPLTPHPGDAA